MASSLRSPQPPRTPQPNGHSGNKSRIPSTWKSPANSSSSIPTLRSLRSLLPFGPNKEPTPVSESVSPKPNSSVSPNASRVSFSAFGYSRKSSTTITRQRNASLTAAQSPIISIERASEDLSPSPAIRRSMSLTTLEKPLPSKPEQFTEPGEVSEAERSLLSEEIVLPPSPNTNLSLAELSTIIEADSSGISKHLPAVSRSPSHSPDIAQLLRLPPPSQLSRSDSGNDTSSLDLSTTRLTEEVLNAFDAGAGGWRTDPTVIDADEGTGSESGKENLRGQQNDVDISLDMDSLDPDLAALLSPNKITSTSGNSTIIPSRPSLDISPMPESRRSSSSGVTSSTRKRHVLGRTSSTPPSDFGGSQDSLHSAVRLGRGAPASPPGSSTNSMPSSVRRAPLTGSSVTRLFTPPSQTPSSSQTDILLSPDRGRSSIDALPLRSSFDRPPSAVPSRSASTIPPRPSSVAAASAHGIRSRKRSMSVDEQSPSSAISQNTYPRRIGSIGKRDWLGPRTAKAFRAAGLLSREDESPPDHQQRWGVNEFGARLPNGHNQLYGSLGRNFPPSWSPTTLSSRETFTTPARSASTVPSSVSDDVVAELKERHSSETAALLAALSDSQRQTRVLREENEELRAGMAKVCEELERMRRDNARLERVLGEMRRERDLQHERERERERERDILDWDREDVEPGPSNGFSSRNRFATFSHPPPPGAMKAWDREIEERFSIPRQSSPLRNGFDDSPDDETDRYFSAVASRRSSPLKDMDFGYDQEQAMADEDDTAKYYPPNSAWGRKRTPGEKERVPYATPEHTQTFLTPVLPAGRSSSSLAPPSQSVSRRNSASSVFMAPPASMRMLLHEEDLPPSASASSQSQSHYSYSRSPSSSPSHVRHRSLNGMGRFQAGEMSRQSSKQPPSPTTTSAELSIRTGSPASLFLKPEHELHLGDLESLDLSLGEPLREDENEDHGLRKG